MIELDGLVAIALMVFWVYCIIDVITTDNSLIRNLPKLVWLLVVLFFSVVGSIVWLIAGRPKGARLAPGSTSGRPVRQARPSRPSSPPPSAPKGPDDDPNFMRRLRGDDK